MLAILAIAIGAAAVLSHTAPAPFLFEAFRPARSLWRVQIPSGATPTLFLTFDDGPNPEWTSALLDALKETGAVATFFLIDDHITTETAPLVRRIARDGHAIGLHSGSRKPMVMSPDSLAAHVTRTTDRIAAITGEQPCRMFRPHAGWRSATMYQALEVDRLSARRVELGHVGLGLVAHTSRRPRQPAPGAARLRLATSS